MSYSTGTVNFTKGSTAVVGIGTAFEANVFSGQSIVGADGRTYTITSVETDTGLTLESAYTGKTAFSASYLISAVTNSDYDEHGAVNSAFSPTYDFESTDETISDGDSLATTSLTTNDNNGRKEDVASTRFFGDGTLGYAGYAVRTSNGSESLRDRFRVRSSGDIDFLNSDGSTVAMKWAPADEEFQVNAQINGTAVTQSLTDTTEGRLMKVGDFGLGNLNDNLNRMEDGETDLPTGFYSGAGAAVTGGYTATTYEYGTFINIARRLNASDWGQTRFHFGVVGALVRMRENLASDWEDMYRLITSKDLVGTVSQSGGVLTGAVFEKPVSGVNGYYRKQADGTLECWHTLTANSGSSKTWTFPSTGFIEAPVVTMTAISTVSASAQLDAAPTTTTATFSVWDKADARRADVVHLRATGRWSDLT